MATAQTALEAGECRLTLTRNERELLHLLLAIARERPVALIGEEAADTPAARVMGATVARIQAKLPPRGSGTY